MKTESKIMFWVFLASLPACYFTIAPAIVSAAVFVLLLAIDTAHDNAKVEIDALKTEMKSLWVSNAATVDQAAMDDLRASIIKNITRIDESFFELRNRLIILEEKKFKAPTVNLGPLLERIDKLETSVNSVNIALGFGDFSKAIK